MTWSPWEDFGTGHLCDTAMAWEFALDESRSVYVLFAMRVARSLLKICTSISGTFEVPRAKLLPPTPASLGKPFVDVMNNEAPDLKKLKKRNQQFFREVAKNSHTSGLTGKWKAQDRLRSQRAMCTVTPQPIEKQKTDAQKDRPDQHVIVEQLDTRSLFGSDSSDTDENEESGYTDTDYEEEVEGCTTCKPAGTLAVKENNVRALEAALRDLEQSGGVEESAIGTACLRLAQMCDALEADAVKVLRYAERALKLLKPPDISIERASCLQAIGSAHYKMDEAEKAVPPLQQAALILEKIGGNHKEKDIGRLMYAVQVFLGLCKMALGKQKDALKHYENGIAINERTLAPGSPDLAKSYVQAAEAYVEAQKHAEALHLCTKALPIYSNFYGSSSYQVASLRRFILVIHKDLKEYSKVISELNIVRPILKDLGKLQEVVYLDLAYGEAYISLGKYRDAVAKLQEVLKETKDTSRIHGEAMVLLAKAYLSLNEGKEASKYCKKAFELLKSKKLSLDAALSLMELAEVYEQLNKSEEAVTVLKSALAILEQYPGQEKATAKAESQIGVLYNFIGKVEEGLPYLEKAAVKVEEVFGSQSEELLSLHNHIAMANLEQGDYKAALPRLISARTLSIELYGHDDFKTIGFCDHLVNTYSALNMFDEAIECQRHVIELINRTGPVLGLSVESAEKKLRDLMQHTKAESAGKTRGLA